MVRYAHYMSYLVYDTAKSVPYVPNQLKTISTLLKARFEAHEPTSPLKHTLQPALARKLWLQGLLLLYD